MWGVRDPSLLIFDTQKWIFSTFHEPIKTYNGFAHKADHRRIHSCIQVEIIMEREAKARARRETDIRILKILSSIILFLCCIIVGIGYGSFYFVNTSVEKAKSATATGQVLATATGISYVTQIAGYEIYDDFNTNPHHWETGIEDNEYWKGVISVRNGTYTWDIREIKEPDSYSWRGYDQKFSHQNFDLSVDVERLKGSPEFLCYGVVFRASPRDFDSGAYLFSICDSGVFEVWYENEVDGSETIFPWTRSAAIRSGGPNTISVNAYGENVTLSINNVIVTEFKDKHVIPGYVYLAVHMYDDQPGMIEFDNFALQPR